MAFISMMNITVLFNALSFISQNGDITCDIYTMGDLILGRNNEPPSKLYALSLCF